MIPRSVFILVCLSVAVVACSRGGDGTAFVKYDDGPLKGLGLPFSESVRVGDVLYLSGQIGTNADGELEPGGIEAEANRALLNIAAVLERRGLTMANVAKCTVFLADVGEWAAFNEVYVRHFAAPYPARSALGANGLAAGARTEIECMAVFD